MLFQGLIVIHVGQRRHIKAGDPHINDNGNMEIGFFLFKRCVQFFGTLAVFYAAEVIIHIRLIVAADTGYHGHKGHWLQFAQFFFGYCNTFWCLLLNKPIRILFLEYSQKRISDCSAGTHHHRFLNSVRILLARRNIMIVDIHCKAFQTRRLTKNNLHRAHSLLAGFNIVSGSAILCTLFIISLDLLNLFLIQQNFCNTGMILNRHSQTVCDSLIHCIAVNFLTECLVCFCNRRATETNKGCLWECFFQHFCVGLGQHGTHILVSILAELNSFSVLQLCSVCFVGKTNDVGTAIDQADLVSFSIAEFLDGTNVKSATFT